MALNWNRVKHLYDPLSGLRKGGYLNATSFTYDLFRVEAFGSIEAANKYDADYYNDARHTREKKTRRDEFGLSKFDYQCWALGEFINLAFEGGREEYNALRDSQAKAAYHKRVKENGLYDKRYKAERERYKNDKDYREKTLADARKRVKENIDRVREVKKKSYKKNYEKNKARYWRERYGDAAETAKATWHLEKTIREIKKRGK